MRQSTLGVATVFAGGYGGYAAQKADGSLLILGYEIDGVFNQSDRARISKLLSNEVVGNVFNYGAGGATLQMEK